MSGFAELVTGFTVVHQALIDLVKLTGLKARRYWEAMAYIVYGPRREPLPSEQRARDVLRARETVRPPSATPTAKTISRPKRKRFTMFGTIPKTLDPAVTGAWVGGPEHLLIESFLLRALGDSPVTDVSDADIRNVVEVARAADPVHGPISKLLEDLVRTGTRRPDELWSLDTGRIAVDRWNGGQCQFTLPV